MGYGVADAGIDEVTKAVENAPFTPIIALCVVELIVIATVSPFGGKLPTAEIVPDRLIELVPAGMLCDSVRLLKVVALTPLAVKPIDCMVLLMANESSVQVSVAVAGPVVVGWKVTKIPQTEFAERVPEVAQLLWFGSTMNSLAFGPVMV